jgi:peptidoglycan hydrolase-like protein with peptidoglycan-binding domain
MRKLLSGRITVRLTLAALAAGGLTLPAVAQGTAQKSAHPSTAHHSAKHSSSSGSTKTSSSKSIVSTPTKSAATPSSASKTSTTKKSASHKGAKGYPGKSSRRVKGQAAPAPERVNEIQEALAKNGSYAGTPSGKWDDSTADAMRKFQSSNGLNPTGKMDARTLQKLGLGSEIAGTAAPTPPPNTANRLLSSSNHHD